MAGRFITFEGGDGAGKTTQIRLLAERLERTKINFVRTREPGGCPASETLRNLLVKGDINWDPCSEVLLHYAARREHLVQTIWPAMNKNHWVISDRFSDSTVAYQGYGMDFDLAQIKAIHDAVVGSFKPDLTIILDVDPEIGVRRSKGFLSDENRYEKMGAALHQKLRDGFLDIAKAEPDRCIVIDASQDKDIIHDMIWHSISHRFLR